MTSYADAIRSMTWSYSRIKAFEDCPQRWFLKYLYEPALEPKPLFFSSYGVFMHRLIERFLRDGISNHHLRDLYLCGFSDQVAQGAPSETVFSGYFKDGLSCIDRLRRTENAPLAVEKRLNFQIDGFPFTGILDLAVQNEDRLVLVDHKSRNLKPRSNHMKPTKTDLELDEYLTQLYLYGEAVFQASGRYPDVLCFHCFRSGQVIREPFRAEAAAAARRWAVHEVEKIQTAGSFPPRMDFFKCHYLCEMQDHCDYFVMNYGSSKRS